MVILWMWSKCGSHCANHQRWISFDSSAACSSSFIGPLTRPLRFDRFCYLTHKMTFIRSNSYFGKDPRRVMANILLMCEFLNDHYGTMNVQSMHNVVTINWCVLAPLSASWRRALCTILQVLVPYGIVHSKCVVAGSDGFRLRRNIELYEYGHVSGCRSNYLRGIQHKILSRHFQAMRADEDFESPQQLVRRLSIYRIE